MFDEKKRLQLLRAYNALPDLERAVCRFLSVIYTPVALTNLTHCLNASPIETPTGRQWNAQRDVLPLLEHWRSAGLIDTVRERKTDYWYLDRLLAEALTREALALGAISPKLNLTRKLPAVP